jgi:branched-chain amino acid transport system substrate-binding protein
VDLRWTPAVGQAAGGARGAATLFWGAAVLCVASLALTGCLGDDEPDQPARIRGDVATVYLSAPRHGSSKADAEEVLAGAHRALADRDGRAGGLRIRLRQLPATDDGEQAWDPALVAENANRAAEDPHAIAYLGELDYGATAVSLPITNDAGLLQVSPGDGLTSLTERVPGRPRAGPLRYYPTGTRTFVRVGPTDLKEAEALVARLDAIGARRLGLVFDREIYGRELVAALADRARRAGMTIVASEEYRGRPEDVPEQARRLSEPKPDAVVRLGVAGPETVPLLAALDELLPGVPILASSGMLASPGGALPPLSGGIEAVGPIVSRERAGYDAMRLVLRAVARGGRDRGRVIAAARELSERAPGTDRLVLYRSGADGRFRRVAVLP